MRNGLTTGLLILAVTWSPMGHTRQQTAAPASAASTSQPVIRSQAELTRYLKQTPRNAPPLGWLSPGGRKRFLGELVFTPRGVGTFSYQDLQNELGHSQIVKILDLFDLGDYGKVIQGLTPAEQARRQHERLAAARARGCHDIATCPESRIEQQYDKLVLQRPDRSMPDAQRAAWHAKRYDRLMSRYQIAGNLASVDRPDLRLLKRAAEHVVFWNPDATYIGQLQADLAEMQRRGMTDDRDYTGLYRALVSSRHFDAAQKLAQAHPGMDIVALPAWRPPANLPAGQPTALSLTHDGRTMTRKAFDLSAPLRIVIVASCHFSQDAARAIHRDPKLRPLFAKHAVWLASQSDSIADARTWNKEFPDQPIHIAWQDSEWSKLDSWAMPTFYVFRHGKLVDQWAGWPADTGMRTLRKHLERDGLLKAGAG